jgi:hypothetical protein
MDQFSWNTPSLPISTPQAEPEMSVEGFAWDSTPAGVNCNVDDGDDDPFRTRGLSAPSEPLPCVSTQPLHTNILLSGQEHLVKQQGSWVSQPGQNIKQPETQAVKDKKYEEDHYEDPFGISCVYIYVYV